jgi:hypothetical protein
MNGIDLKPATELIKPRFCGYINECLEHRFDNGRNYPKNCKSDACPLDLAVAYRELIRRDD